MADYLTLDKQYKLFVWALWKTGIITTGQLINTLKFINSLREQNLSIQDALDECAGIESLDGTDGSTTVTDTEKE